MDINKEEIISDEDIKFPCSRKDHAITSLSKCKECWYRSTCDDYITMANEDF